jgi:DNA polymerase-3 subunit epsilon
MSDLEAMAAALEASGDYRVLRRLAPRISGEANGAETRLGIALDVETTGLDSAKDEIIELAMVPFTYTLAGEVVEVRPAFRRLRQPSKPIPPEITALTGIDDAMVAGHAIDPAEVAEFAAPAGIIIAHHAAFDRPFVERLCKAFAAKAWACSMAQIDWKGEGIEGTKLGYLASASGFFYERHRAADDCAAVVELLARPLPRSGAIALAKLLDAARRPGIRIWALNSPFPKKDQLKARGYQWSDGSNGRPKSWFVEVDEPATNAELEFLQREIFGRVVNLPVTRLTAFNRFSGAQ